MVKKVKEVGVWQYTDGISRTQMNIPDRYTFLSNRKPRVEYDYLLPTWTILITRCPTWSSSIVSSACRTPGFGKSMSFSSHCVRCWIRGVLTNDVRHYSRTWINGLIGCIFPLRDSLPWYGLAMEKWYITSSTRCIPGLQQIEKTYFTSSYTSTWQ